MAAPSQHNSRNNKHRYRKIALKIWGDEKFVSLSPMPPSAQGLWLFLLAYPAQDAIPGVYRAGRASMAEQLGWEVEDFDRCFQEIADLGMAVADWSAKLVWLPNAARFNPPESPNVVVWWSKAWPEIPECPMKARIYEALRAHVYATGAAYGEEFDKRFTQPAPTTGTPTPKPSGKPSDKPSDKASDKASDKPLGDKASDKPSDKASDKASAARGAGVSDGGAPPMAHDGWAPDLSQSANPHRQGDCKASDKASDKGCPNHEHEHIHKQEHTEREAGGAGERPSSGTSPSAPSLSAHGSGLNSKPAEHDQQASLDGGSWQPPVGGGESAEDDDVLEAVRESQTKMGTRLPPGYVLSAHWLLLAKKTRPDLPDDQIKTASETFVAYWSAKPGKEGLKLNWLSTWLNWVRKERVSTAGEGRSGQARLIPPSPPSAGDPERERRKRAFLAKYPGARFPAEDGFKPGG